MLKTASGTFAKTRNDFVRRLRRLGAVKGARYCRPADAGGTIEEVLTVFLSCSRRNWVECLGEPQSLARSRDTVACPGCPGFCCCTWQQPCSDGLVLCDGSLCERQRGRPWIVLRRLRLTDAFRLPPAGVVELH